MFVNGDFLSGFHTSLSFIMQLPTAFFDVLLTLTLFPFAYSTPTPANFSPNLTFLLSNSTAFTTPIAATWMYLSDDTDYNAIPAAWHAINYRTVDILYIGPVGIQPNGLFELYNGTNGSLTKRFHLTIQRARAQNPNIKIMASQWWGGSPDRWGDDLSWLEGKGAGAIERYTSSVAAFMKRWPGADGYDVDYEDKNARQSIADILKHDRSSMLYPLVGNTTVQFLPQKPTISKPQYHSSAMSTCRTMKVDLGLRLRISWILG